MKFRFLTIALLAGMLLAGCNKDNNEPNGGNTDGGDIVFNIGFAPQNDGKTGTRVATDAQFKSTWENNDEIGIFAVKRATGATGPLVALGNYMHNVKLTYNETDDKWTADAGVVLYYPNDGDVLDFYAYYPYDVAATDPLGITFNVATDQSIAANYNLSDLLSAKQAGVAKGTTVDLTFAHKLALVQVDVDPTYIDHNGGFTVTLRGCKAGGTFNLGDGVLTTAGNAQGVKMLRVEQPGDGDYTTKYTYRALVPAQSVAIGTNLCLMAQNGQLFNTPALTAALDLKAGDAKLYTATLPSTALQTVKIAKGSFQMGETGWTVPVHAVTLTKDFYMSKYAITNAQYAAFLNDKGIDHEAKGSVTYYKNDFINAVTETQTFISGHAWGVAWDGTNSKWISASGKDDFPIINVTWFGAKAYADWVGGSLPTEAQWEYACRAGTTTAFSFGDNDSGMDTHGWYSGNSQGGTKAVGQKTANLWGLYDMHGNVWEWCSDWHSVYDDVAATDPPGAPVGSYRVLRGGSWGYDAQYCHSASRDGSLPGDATDSIGFRVVFVP